MSNFFSPKTSSRWLLFLVLILVTGALVVSWYIFFNKPKNIPCPNGAKICDEMVITNHTAPDCFFDSCRYEIVERTDSVCSVDEDCVLPLDTSKRSGCQKAARCLQDKKCAVICLPPSTNPTVSIYENWKTMVGLIKECQVERIMQTHDERVTATLKNGYQFTAIEPTIDEVFNIVRDAEKQCGKIVIATE